MPVKIDSVEIPAPDPFPLFDRDGLSAANFHPRLSDMFDRLYRERATPEMLQQHTLAALEALSEVVGLPPGCWRVDICGSYPEYHMHLIPLVLDELGPVGFKLRKDNGGYEGLVHLKERSPDEPLIVRAPTSIEVLLLATRAVLDPRCPVGHPEDCGCLHCLRLRALITEKLESDDDN